MQRQYAALAALLCVSLAEGRQDKLSCGTHDLRAREEFHLHRQSNRAGIKRVRKATAAAVVGERQVGGLTVRPDIGNIAILDDADGVVSRRNPFNLNLRTLKFTPSDRAATKYRYQLGADTYDATTAANGTRVSGIGDDDSREVQLPFAFPFFGKTWTSVHLNSDGNLTFGDADAAITDRSLGRFTSGAPRIAALFRDLDPTRARTGITTSTSGNAFVISWVQVPEYRDAGTGPLQTFQIRLHPDGTVEFAYSDVSTQEAVVGIGPGRLTGAASVVSFLNTPSSEYTSTIAERFAGKEQIDIFSAAQKFYLNHEDTYDYLVFYNNLGIDSDDGAVAFEVTVRNNRKGFGDSLVDVGAETGSKRRLQALLNMGPLTQYPKDPDAKVPARFSVGDTPITTLAHEAGHLFLAFASIRDENDSQARPMLGLQSAHWNFTLNTDASLMEGNRIQDNGPGTSPRFQSVATVEGFSPLDQYLMGLRAPEEVPDTFLVTNARGTILRLPRVGATFDGERRDIRIDEIVAAEGRRTPDHTVSQRRFRFAFVLITAAGNEPSSDQIAQLELWRGRFEEFYNKATSGRGFADTSLKQSVRVSTWPASGVRVGASSTATLTLESPAASTVTVLLRAQNGNVQLPSSVTIPAGATQASFTITGVRQGIDEVVAEPSVPRYETVYSRIQVSATEALRLAVTSGDRQQAVAGRALAQPVRLRVTDANDLPYPGIPVSSSLTGGGSVDRGSVVTDENGFAAFAWTPGSGTVNELRAEIPGGAAVVATALGRPLLSAGGVLNAASFATGLTPGGIGTLFGANLAGGTVEVLLNGGTVPVLYSDTRQVNFYVPDNTQTGTAQLAVRTGFAESDTMQVPVRAVQPGIFFDAATGNGAVLSPGGGVIEIYSTGLGAVETASTGHRVTRVVPQVQIGGATAEVLFSGLAPGFVGLYQVNARVPSGLTPGVYTLSITAGGLRSNEVRIQVR